MEPRVRTSVSTERIDMDELRKEALSAASGAVVTFSGDVRNHDGGRDVIALDYEVHPSAPEVLAEVAAEIVNEFALQALIIEHRYGSLAIGDTALGVAAASGHRKDAFAGCSAAVDRVKEKLPIWKHQFFNDGTDEWVNSA